MLSLLLKAQCGLNLLKGSQHIMSQADQAFDRYLSSKNAMSVSEEQVNASSLP